MIFGNFLNGIFGSQLGAKVTIRMTKVHLDGRREELPIVVRTHTLVPSARNAAASIIAAARRLLERIMQ